MTADTLRRTLCLGLPLAQVVVAAMPALGLGFTMAEATEPSRTPVVPAGYAFPTMWGAIFLLALLHGVWQVLPTNRGAPLAHRVGWPLAGAFAADIGWMMVAQSSGRNGFGLVVIILAALGCAMVAFLAARRSGEKGGAARWIVYPLTGLLAGWLTAAAFANISGAARAAGMVPAEGFGATLAAVLVLLAAGGFAAAVAWASRGSGWYAGGVGYALLAVVLANLGVNQLDLLAAAAAAAMLALVAAVSWGRRGPATAAAGRKPAF